MSRQEWEEEMRSRRDRQEQILREIHDLQMQYHRIQKEIEEALIRTTGSRVDEKEEP